jgi:hypothetical protein
LSHAFGDDLRRSSDALGKTEVPAHLDAALV